MSADRQRVSSGSPYEKPIGFSRAVRVGNMVFVSGTAPVSADGKNVGAGDAGAQTRRCLDIIAAALKETGAEMRHVVRTRMFITDAALWEEVGNAHGEVFGEIRPAATMVVVSGLLDPAWLVEIEAEALIVDDDQNWQNAWAPTD
ncbi:MAG: RidA family protein [Hyphomicrobiaceae bacterium]|nr:RidA family protein [Hyphomicrobiaceae bacterium]